MKAIQLSSYGGPEVLRLQEIDLGPPQKGQVLVRNRVAGVNFIDIYKRRGTYPVDLPYVPGFEASGIVEAVGENVMHVKPGDRVSYMYEAGSYAEFSLVPATHVIPLPKEISFELGAAFPLQGMTAHYLLHEFRKVKPHDIVLVHAAAGGMGLLLVQWAKHLGARVLGTVSTEEKAHVAKEFGADETILYTKHNFAEEVSKLTDGRGVDLIIDGVGKTTFEGNLEACAVRGNIVIFGAASGPAAPISPNVFMKKSLTVSGGSLFNFLLTPQEFAIRANAVIDGLVNGFLELRVDNTFPLEKAPEAHQQLESRSSIGKVLISL